MIIIDFGQFEGTPGLGVVGYNIQSVQDKRLTSSGVAEIVSALQEHSGHYPRSRNVNLVGFENPADEVAMYTLCQSLKGYEYNVRAMSTGEYYHPWYKLCDHLAVHVVDPTVWTKFPANQVIYRAMKDVVKEPDLPPAMSSAWLYLDPTFLTEAQVLTFLRKAKSRWGLYSEIKPVLTSQIIFEGVLP